MEIRTSSKSGPLVPSLADVTARLSQQTDATKQQWLVARDDANALASSLIEAARDSDLRADWGEAGRNHAARRFGLERMVENYRRVCLEGLATQPDEIG
jgi:glycosyltransferase involved in cell wall biosynthesis